MASKMNTAMIHSSTHTVRTICRMQNKPMQLREGLQYNTDLQHRENPIPTSRKYAQVMKKRY